MSDDVESGRKCEVVGRAGVELERILAYSSSKHLTQEWVIKKLFQTNVFFNSISPAKLGGNASKCNKSNTNSWNLKLTLFLRTKQIYINTLLS